MAKRKRYIDISLGYLLLLLFVNDVLTLMAIDYLDSPHPDKLVPLVLDFLLYLLQNLSQLIKDLI